MADLPVIRQLTDPDDRAAVAALYRRAADYVQLETGAPPGPETIEDFFRAAPPGIDPGTGLRLGVFRAGRLDGIAELSFGFPEPADAYLGLLLLAEGARGEGLGTALLGKVVEAARARGAPRLFVAVLDANPRGRAFWEREGFRIVLSTPPQASGRKMHIRHRMVRAL